MTQRFVQFGAGNIGRSFIGRLFSAAGWETVFLDVDQRLVDRLNEAGRYRVVVKENNRDDLVLQVGPVRGVNGRDIVAVTRELLRADCAATSVGQAGLPSVIGAMVPALLARREASLPPLNVLIAENIRSGASFFRAELSRRLGPGIDPDGLVGLIETSIGKMVPIMPREALEADPLALFTEAYDTLIADERGWKGKAPDLPGLKLVDNIGAWVDRKLFIHNLGHAATAYLGWRTDPSKNYIWEALDLPGVEEGVRSAMLESAAALTASYPADLPKAELDEHVADLLSRFRNRALGDTVHRVGRDLPRKLARDDRLVGACLLAARQGLPFGAIAAAIRAALAFRSPDGDGRLFSADEDFHSRWDGANMRTVLREVSGLDEKDASDARVIRVIEEIERAESRYRLR